MYNYSMLQLSEALLNKPVLSLRSGGTVAWIVEPIFNPNNLKLEGFYCDDTIDKKRLILLCQDIRELSSQGFIIDDHDVLAQPRDLVRLKSILNLHFELLKKPVVTVSKDKIGKISDYAIETDTMYVQKLYASRSILRNLASGSLSIDRSQIIEITSNKIIINDLLQGTPSPVAAGIA